MAQWKISHLPEKNLSWPVTIYIGAYMWCFWWWLTFFIVYYFFISSLISIYRVEVEALGPPN